MDCNKEEALKIKVIAENFYKAKDFAKAKEFCLKAQELFPDLEGLQKLLAIINVCYAHEHTINGEKDYYGILGVHPSADEDAIKKQYRRMLLDIHPDKNKLDGAHGAFVIVSEAWEVLKDKNERMAYDMKLHQRASDNDFFNVTTTHAPSVPSQPCSSSFSSHDPSVPSKPFFSFFSFQDPSVPSQQYSSFFSSFRAEFHYGWNPPEAANSQHTPSQQQPHHDRTPETSSMHVPVASARNPAPKRKAVSQSRPKSNSGTETFWTGCNRCRTKYAFQKILVNENVQCPRCLQTFLAIEMSAPPAAAIKEPILGHTNKGQGKVSNESDVGTTSSVKTRRKDEKVSQAIATAAENKDEDIDLTLHIGRSGFS